MPWFSTRTRGEWVDLAKISCGLGEFNCLVIDISCISIERDYLETSVDQKF